jgi:hypothetical protein
MMATATTLTVTTAHTFILTVSHGLLFRNPFTGDGTDAAASLHQMSFKVQHVPKRACPEADIAQNGHCQYARIAQRRMVTNCSH